MEIGRSFFLKKCGIIGLFLVTCCLCHLLHFYPHISFVAARDLIYPRHQNSLGGSMTTSDESRKEVRSVKEGLLRPKTKICIGELNV